MKRVERIPHEAEWVFPTGDRIDYIDVPFLSGGLVDAVYVSGDTMYFTVVEDTEDGLVHTSFVTDNNAEVAALRAAIAARAAAAQDIAHENVRANWWPGRPE